MKAEKVDRFAIIKLTDGRIGMFERKNLSCIIGNTQVILKADTDVEVIKYPAQLAMDYLKTL